MLITKLNFDIPLHAGDIPLFRSSIIELVGRENEIFHNHDNSSDSEGYYHFGYPLVQYAVRKGRATIIGLGKGAEAIYQQLLPKLGKGMALAGQQVPISHYHIQQQEHLWEIRESPKEYGLYGWIGLNKTNYRKWKELSDSLSRQEILSKALTGHIRSIGKTVGLDEPKQVVGEVLEVNNQKRVRWHKTELIRFHVRFRTNSPLPCGVGVGRCAAFGYGQVLPIEVYRSILMQKPELMTEEFQKV